MSEVTQWSGTHSPDVLQSFIWVHHYNEYVANNCLFYA